VASFTPRPLYHGERAPDTHFIGAGWAPEPCGRCDKEKRNPCFCQESQRGSPARSLITILTELPRLYSEYNYSFIILSKVVSKSEYTIPSNLTLLPWTVPDGMLISCSTSNYDGRGAVHKPEWASGPQWFPFLFPTNERTTGNTTDVVQI